MAEKHISPEPKSILEVPKELRATALNERYRHLLFSPFLSEQEKLALKKQFAAVTRHEQDSSFRPTKEKILEERTLLEEQLSDWRMIERVYAGRKILDLHARIDDAIKMHPQIKESNNYRLLQRQLSVPEVQQDTLRVYQVLEEMLAVCTTPDTVIVDNNQQEPAWRQKIQALLAEQFKDARIAATIREFVVRANQNALEQAAENPQTLIAALSIYRQMIPRDATEALYRAAFVEQLRTQEKVSTAQAVKILAEPKGTVISYTDVVSLLNARKALEQQDSARTAVISKPPQPVTPAPQQKSSFFGRFGRGIAKTLAGIALLVGIKSSETETPDSNSQQTTLSAQPKEQHAYPNGMPERTRIADDGTVIVTVDSGTRAPEVVPQKADEPIPTNTPLSVPEKTAPEPTQEAPRAPIVSEEKTTPDTIRSTDNAISEAKAEQPVVPERLATHVVVKGDSFIGIREAFLKDDAIRNDIIDWYRSQEKYTDASEATILADWREQQLVDHNISRHTGGKLSYDGKKLYPGQQLEIHRDPTSGVSIAWHDQGELDTHAETTDATAADIDTEATDEQQIAFAGTTYTNNETVLVKDPKTKQWKQYQVRVNPDEPVAEGNIQLQGTMKTKTGKDRSYVYALSEKSAEKLTKGKIIDGLAIEFLPGDGYRVEFNGESGKGVIDALAALILDQDYQGDQSKAKEAYAVANRVIAKARDIVDTGDYETTYSRVPNMIRKGDEAVFKKSGQGWQLESLNLQGKGK